MTVININNISGIASVNAQSNSLELFDNTGASLLDLNANTATFPGGISVGGTVTYDDVTNIDSVGVITARSGVHVTGGNVGIGTDGPSAKLHVHNGEIRVTNAAETNLVEISTDGNIEIKRSGGGAYIDFADSTSEDYDVRIHESNDGLAFITGGSGSVSERLGISSEGIITKPYQVAFFAYCNIGDHDLTQGDKFQFNVVPPTTQKVAVGSNRTTYNGTNVFDTTNNRFTAPVAGLYHFTVTTYFRRTGDPQTSIVPHVNNVKVTNGANDVFFFSNNDIADGQTLSGSLILQLAANDYVSVHRRSNSQTGTTRFYGPHSHFCGHLIG
jgi:hypothetical protein